jgi:hypothetical protein
MRAGHGNVRATLFDQRVIAIADRMRHHHERQIVVAYALRGHLCERRKCGAHHGNGGNAQRFEFGRVTRGPRG